MTNKPTIETMINSGALAMFSFGAVLLTTNYESWESLLRGILLIFVGVSLEYFKYWGRNNNKW
jgi:hypothetical protein